MISKLKFNFLEYFRFYYRTVGNKLFLSICLSIVVSILDGIGLTMFIPLLQSASGGEQSAQDSLGQLHYITDFIAGLGFDLSLGTVLVTMAILFLVKAVFKFWELNYQAHVMQLFMKRVRNELVSRLGAISYKGFTQLDSGKIQNTFITEMHNLNWGMRFYMAYSQALFMLITYVAFAVLANYQFSILFALSAGVTNLVYSRFYKKVKLASLEISKKGDNFNSYMTQAILYFKYLKSTNYLSTYSNKLRKVIDQTETLNRKNVYYNSITASIREPIILLIVIAVIYIQLDLMGGNLGSIILSLMLFYRALNFLMTIQQNWQNFIQTTGSINNVSKISETMRGLAEGQGEKEFTHLKQRINISDVSVIFGKNTVLDNVNISIPKRQTIALVGESGSGKTTLANVIMGLLNPDKGSLKIDGVPLTDYNLDSYRSKIGYISQDAVVFNDSIFNNVTFWAEPTPENLKRFWEVIEMVSLKTFVENQADKEQTNLGDNGILISGGQKQRISIAREMYKNVELLVLDEATSALDSETELLIQENIEKLHGHYTMVVIAHRLSTIKNVDRIYLLDKGCVSVSGDFENMVQKSEKFKRMVSLQGL